MVDKLLLIKSDVNSGGGGTPRNIGIRYAYGEYLMFVDSDDAITKDALKDFYTVAKNFDADIVHCEKYYQAPGDTVTTDKTLLVERALRHIDFVTEPTLMSPRIEDRINKFISYRFVWGVYSNVFRRDLIMKYDIKFPEYNYGEDAIFTIRALCLAKNIVQIPNVHYVYRERKNSTMRPADISLEYITKTRVNFLLNGITDLNNFMNTIPFFMEHPEYKYAVFDFLIQEHGQLVRLAYSKVPTHVFDKLVCNTLASLKDDTSALTAFLFGRMNLLNLKIIEQQTIINRLQTSIHR